MPRQPREAGEYLHIIVRGVGKQILFEDDADRKKYLFFLKRFRTESNISILAYCLMENHVHLLVHDSDASVSSFMKKIGVSYALYYNRKYDRTGHLFQDRFRSETIKDDAYLLTAFRYILNNPQKAGICKADEYPWSSYREFGTSSGLTDSKLLAEMIGTGAAFHQFMQQQDDNECMEAEHQKKDDAWALSVIRESLHIASGSQLQQFDRKQRDEALAMLKKKGVSIRQLERLTGINRGIIQKV